MRCLPAEYVVEHGGRAYARAAVLVILKEDVIKQRGEDVLTVVCPGRSVAPLEVFADNAEKVYTLVAVVYLDIVERGTILVFRVVCRQ